jgi:hypothetical protein
MRATPRLALNAIPLLLVAATAAAGELRGSVTLGHETQAAHPHVRDTVIWLEQIPGKSEQKLTRAPFHWFWKKRVPPPPLRQLVESGLCYHPHVLAIATGSELVIHNQDTVWHGPFSVSPAHEFDLGKIAPSRADTLSFDSTGVVAVRCDIHPDMSAFVVVTPNHAFTQPDSSGAWRLPELPAGHYVVHAWNPDRGDSRHEVDLPAHGGVTLPLHW